jgi:peptide/nickel transport system substrate-binding protein
MNRSRATWWRVLAVLAALGLVAAACGDDDGGDESSDTSLLSESEEENQGEEEETEEVEPVYGGTVVVGLEAESNTWTPGPAQLANSGLMIAVSVYDPLVSLNAEGEFEPFLAESIEPNDDLTEWTLTLRDGVQFHDGTPLDAETLKWNFDELHFGDDDQTQGSLKAAGVESMEVVDPMTVVYLLSGPNAAFPDQLRGEAGWPVSRVAYEADPEGFGEQPVGTGPFEFVDWVRDGTLTMTRNENYWFTAPNGDQLPYLDGIEFRPITDEDSRVASLASGDVDMMQTLRGSAVKQVLELVDGGGFESSVHVGNNSGSAILNVLEPPLDDVRIRTALAYASDSDAVQVVLGDDGLTEPSTGFFSQDSPWYSDVAAAAYPGAEGRNIDEAIALVEDYVNDPARSDGKAAGEPPVVTYNCPPDPSLIEVSQLQQSLWQEAGITVELNQVEQAQHISNAVGTADTDPPYRGNYSINCWRAGGGEGDPLTALQSFFGPVATTTGNFTNFTDPRIDEQLVILRENADFATRYAAVEEISVVSAEEVPILWSSPTPTVVGYKDTIHGVKNWVLPSGSEGTGTTGSVARFHQIFVTP